jgi:stage IV sporulation protein A
MSVVDATHEIKSSIYSTVRATADKISKAGDIKEAVNTLSENEYIKAFTLDEINLGNGKAYVTLDLDRSLYFDIISELSGFEIDSEETLIKLLCELSAAKSKFDRVAEALEAAEEKGYGIVMPDIEELHLEEPQIVKQSGGYGVRLCASAQSIHMIRANIETEINPIVGTEQQSEDLVKYMLKEYENDPIRIWDSNLFGKSLYELVNDGLHTKLEHMSEESRTKMSETLERIINEGSGGLICIIL